MANREVGVDYPGRFMFFGEAVAFGARFDTPRLADARAAVAISTVGGRVAASEGGYVLDGGFVSFDSAASEVVGAIDGDVYTTRATTRIVGLRIDGVIEIPELTVTLRSTHDTRMQGDPLIHLRVHPDPFRIKWPDRTESEITLWKDCNRYPTHRSCTVSPGAARMALHGADQVLGAVDAMQNPAEHAALKGRAVSVEGTRKPERTPEGVDAYISRYDENITWWALDSRLRPEDPWAPLRPKPGRSDVAECDAYLAARGVRLFFGEYAVTRGRRSFTALRVSFERSPASELVGGEVKVNGSFHP